LLARIPFQTDLAKPFSIRRIVSIPEYYDAFLSQGSPAWKAFRRQDTDRGITLFFPMLITQDHSTVVCRAGDTDIYLKDVTPILCPRSISFIMDIAGVDEFTLAPHGNNLFFEYDPIRSGVIADCMSSEHFGQLAWQFKRMSGSSGLKVQAAIAC